MRNECPIQFLRDFRSNAGRNAGHVHFTSSLERATGFLFSPLVGFRRPAFHRSPVLDAQREAGLSTATAAGHTVAETCGACLMGSAPVSGARGHKTPRRAREKSSVSIWDRPFPFLTCFTGCCGSGRAVPHTDLSLGGSFLFRSFFPFYDIRSN